MPRTASVLSGGSEYSLGELMQQGGTMTSFGTARYTEITSRLSQLVREGVMQEQRRRGAAKAMVVPYAAGVEVLQELQTMYPEFALVGIPLWPGVHAGLEAERMAASACALLRLSQFTRDIVSLGNTMLPAALLGMSGVHTEIDGTDAYSVHAGHTSQQLYMQLAANSKSISREYQCGFDSAAYRDFLKGRVHQLCDVQECGVRAGGYYADLSVCPLSLKQFCAGMISCGASVGEATVPYSSEMLVSPRGPWGTHGVHYEITSDELLFKYPDGVAGNTIYPLGAWFEWLYSQAVNIDHEGEVVRFQLEVSNVRGSFLSVTVTRLETNMPMQIATRTHALELPCNDDRYVVRSYRLKDLSLDPMKISSYESFTYMPSKRVVDKVFSHAMSLDKEAFKDGAVLKRAAVSDNRITTAGLSIRVERPIDPETFAQLTQDVVLRAFVARYNMGELGADLMSQLNTVKGFASATMPSKIMYLTCALVRAAWDWTGQVLVDLLRGLVTSGLEMIAGRKVSMPEFNPAPTFVLFEAYTRWLGRTVYKRIESGGGGTLVSPNLRGAVAGYRYARGYSKPEPPVFSTTSQMEVRMSTVDLSDVIEDTRVPAPPTEGGVTLVDTMSVLNEFSNAPFDRFEMRQMRPVHDGNDFDMGPENYLHDGGYINTINEQHEIAFPGMALQNFEADALSLNTDPQHRAFEADRMQIPLVGNVVPAPSEVYKSFLKTYQTEKKQQTLQVLLSALEARNLATPQISTLQNVDAKINDIWENFLDVCCVSDARAKLQLYAEDLVGFEKEILLEWTKKAKPEKVKSMLKELSLSAKALEEYDVFDFDMMVKSDGKPPLSTKPIKQQIQPHLIVYHKSVLSAAYSAIFRVLTRRFLSLLKPEWMVNLLKDNEAVRQHLSAYYPWGTTPEFLENDYGKFDKSQSELCVRLDEFVDRKLGMLEGLLRRWYDGHETSVLHSVQHGLTLWIDWQRRSGGGNTSYGNVKINILSTAYVYRNTDVICAAYIGDDSVLVCRKVVADGASVQTLGDVFNLEAKFLVPRHPYFASNFIVFDEDQRQALLVPDPFKRAQRLGVSVNAKDPQWYDKVRSIREAFEPYKHRRVQQLVEPGIRSRYDLPPQASVPALLNALATVAESYETARGCWHADTSLVYNL